MTYESSAIARLVNLAHYEEIQSSPDNDPQPADATMTAGSGPILSSPLLAVIGIIVIGASVGGGYLLARQQTSASVDTQAATAVVASEPEPTKPANTALAVAGSDAREEQIEPDLNDERTSVKLELAKSTGFDVLVTPNGAKVSLDGQLIGAAPLRVRNLLPGAHSIDIEGPQGYFGRHLEFDLEAGKAVVLNLVLESVADSDLESESGAVQSPPITNSEMAALGRRERQQDVPNAESKKGTRRSEASKRKRRYVASADEERVLANAEEVELGTLMLGAKPPCEIIINGKKTGLSTPQRAIQLPEGMHRIILVNKEHDIRKSFKVKIKPGRTTRAIQDLSLDL